MRWRWKTSSGVTTAENFWTRSTGPTMKIGCGQAEVLEEDAPASSQDGRRPMVIHQGDVFWITLAEPAGSNLGYRHLHVIVQNNLFNESKINTTVVCTPYFHSQNAGPARGIRDPAVFWETAQPKTLDYNRKRTRRGLKTQKEGLRIKENEAMRTVRSEIPLCRGQVRRSGREVHA